MQLCTVVHTVPVRETSAGTGRQYRVALFAAHGPNLCTVFRVLALHHATGLCRVTPKQFRIKHCPMRKIRRQDRKRYLVLRSNLQFNRTIRHGLRGLRTKVEIMQEVRPCETRLDKSTIHTHGPCLPNRIRDEGPQPARHTRSRTNGIGTRLIVIKPLVRITTAEDLRRLAIERKRTVTQRQSTVK